MEGLLRLENLSVVDIWNGLVVLIVLALLFFALYKGIIMIRDDIAKRKEKKQLKNMDITEQIADKVMEKLQPKLDEQTKAMDKRFEEIDKKLDTDKQDIELHARQLNDHESRVSRLEGGNRALCHGVLALLEKDNTQAKAQRAMKNFLIDGIYKESDWE